MTTTIGSSDGEREEALTDEQIGVLIATNPAEAKRLIRCALLAAKQPKPPTWTREQADQVGVLADQMLAKIKPSPEAAGPTESNQCDGCMSGAALDGDLHRDNNGRATMICQAHRYA